MYVQYALCNAAPLPAQVVFDGADVFGGVMDDNITVNPNLQNARDNLGPGFRSSYNVQCLPLYTLLLVMTEDFLTNSLA